jgi:membrane protease YdiL (CAAX protease family)
MPGDPHTDESEAQGPVIWVAEDRRRLTWRPMPVSPAEAALLVFALFLMTTAGLGRLHYASGGTSIAAWLVASLLPSLLLLAAAVWMARRFRPLVPLACRPSVLLLALGALGLGLAGGALIGPTSPDRLAPLLPASSQVVWALVWVGLLVPFIEELYFRGVLQSALVRSTNHAGVYFAAVAFAIAHIAVAGSGFMWPIYAIGWFLMGLGFGVFQWYGRSFWPAFAGHAGWNLGIILAAVWPAVTPLPGLAAAAIFVPLASALYWRERAREGTR